MSEKPRASDWRNLLIAALTVAVAILGAELFTLRVGAPRSPDRATPPGLEPVGVFDVFLDRESLEYLDVLFDRPLGEGRVGEILAAPPATLQPATGGAWRWQDTNVLRFEPSDRFAMATEYTVTLIEERLVGGEQVLEGEREFRLRTDQFQVEEARVFEEPISTETGRVRFHGDLRFNYPVEPEELITRLRLIDPEQRQPVEIELETGYRSRAIGFRTAAVDKGPEARELILTVDRTLTPARGNVPLVEDYRQPLPLGSRFRLEVRSIDVTPGVPETTIRVELSSPVDPRLVASYLNTEPPVQARIAGAGNTLTLTGDFRPGSRYLIRLEEGLPGSDEAFLAESFQEEIRVDDLASSVDFQSRGSFLSARGSRQLGVESVNVARAQLTVDRVYQNNLLFLFQYFGYLIDNDFSRGSLHRALGDRIHEETLELGAQRNRPLVRSLDLGEIVDSEEPGLYRVGLLEPGEWYGSQRWVLVTDLGVVAKVGQGELTAWSWSFSDLSPLAGVEMELRSSQNQVLARGRSDAQGFWQIRGLDTQTTTPFLLTLRRGDDFSFLHLPRTRIDTAGLDVAGASAGPRGYSGFLWGDRDLYRPGETLVGAALLRDAGLVEPPVMPVQLVHRDPLGRESSRQQLQTDDRGSLQYSLELPDYTATGHHRLELLVADEVVGQRRFQVEEFVPDRIRVRIHPRNKVLELGDELSFRVESAYLFGAPAAGLRVESRVRLEPSPFAPPGHPEFTFGNPERELEAKEILEAESELDPEGRGSFSVRLPEHLEPASGLEARIVARVQEQGGRGVTALLRQRIDAYPRYVGLRRTAEDFPEPGERVEIGYLVVDSDGDSQVPPGLRAELFHDRWHSSLRRTPAGGFRYSSTRETQLVDTKALAGASEGSFHFTPTEYGSYRVVLSDPEGGASSQLSFYTGGWGYSPWALKNPGRLEMSLDRDEYRPGDRAVLQIRAPFPGRLLVTVERERVFDQQIHLMPGNSATVQIPIRESYRPNAFVTATVVRSATELGPGEAGRAFGAVPLSVDRETNRLRPQLELPKEMRPEGELTVQIRTAPHATLTVAAVDEGILQLVAQETPDPFEHFYRRRALQVASHDTFSLLLPEIEGISAPGGGIGQEGQGQYVRSDGIRRVRPVALWSGTLRADSSGLAQARFEIPRFQGSLRVMTVASAGRRFGSSEEEVRVRDPIVLLPSAPRVLAFGDRSEIPVALRNDSGRSGFFTIRLDAHGAGEVLGEARRSLELEEGGEATVHFELRAANSPGALTLEFRADGEGVSTRDAVEIPVRPDLPAITEEIAGRLDTAESELGSTSSERFLASTVRRLLRIGPSPLVQLSGHLEELLLYPFGCLEQTASRIFPLLYLEELARELEPELFADREPAHLVAGGLRRIASMQLDTGAFALWPGGRNPHPWGTIYATHLLVEAQLAGHHVPSSTLDRALDYLAQGLRAKASYGAPELRETAYALYVMARAGRADTGTMDFLRQRHAAGLSAESRAQLAAAFATLGNRRAVEELTAAIRDVERVQRQTGQQFASTLRNRALLLLAMLDAVPSDPLIPALADRLAREARPGQRWTTQEAGLALHALGRLFALQQALGPYSGTVLVAGETVAHFTADPITVLLPAQGIVTVQMDPAYPEGAAYFSLRTRGVPTDAEYRPEQAGIEIGRRLLTRDGDPADPSIVTQGDLLVLEVRARSLAGPLQNVAIQNLLPAGLEIENARLASREALPWLRSQSPTPAFLDLRDDQVLFFVDLPADDWQSYLALVRAVSPGEFRTPPLNVEAMYAPRLRAQGERDRLRILRRE